MLLLLPLMPMLPLLLVLAADAAAAVVVATVAVDATVVDADAAAADAAAPIAAHRDPDATLELPLLPVLLLLLTRRQSFVHYQLITRHGRHQSPCLIGALGQIAQ